MGSRRRARQFALQAMYQADLMGISAMDSLNHLWTGHLDGEGLIEGAAPDSEEVEFAQRLVAGAIEDLDALDVLIEECSTNWRLARMPIVDRNILRLAAFEMKHCADIPANVSVNEAVELAKQFGTADSRAFVNGIVDRMGRQLGRLDPDRRRKR
ncbi:MAG: transcription antitermination factor NusB [Alphaproteobacteria bacterium]|nr:transcription antitermination factor NusB [Alphaproteobacteria bacterium]